MRYVPLGGPVMKILLSSKASSGGIVIRLTSPSHIPTIPMVKPARGKGRRRRLEISIYIYIYIYISTKNIFKHW